MARPYPNGSISVYKSIMASYEPSPTNQTYLISIAPPQEVEQSVARLTDNLKSRRFPTSPLPPMIPILETTDKPAAPVPGLLPVCTESLRPGKQLTIDSGSAWILWPVESSGWFDRLAEALTQADSPGDSEGCDLFPLRRGIPLALIDGEGYLSTDETPEISGWRALNLICWSIEFLPGRPWYMSVSWYPLWRRRLKRAPGLTNNNKQP